MYPETLVIMLLRAALYVYIAIQMYSIPLTSMQRHLPNLYHWSKFSILSTLMALLGSQTT